MEAEEEEEEEEDLRLGAGWGAEVSQHWFPAFGSCFQVPGPPGIDPE